MSETRTVRYCNPEIPGLAGDIVAHYAGGECDGVPISWSYTMVFDEHFLRVQMLCLRCKEEWGDDYRGDEALPRLTELDLGATVVALGPTTKEEKMAEWDDQQTVRIATTLENVAASLKRIETLLATRPAEESRSSAKVTENSKGEPACETKGYSGDLAALEGVAAETVRVYKQMRASVLQP